MCGVKNITYKPLTENHEIYKQMYDLYKQLHDAFGRAEYSGRLGRVMKDLLDIKEYYHTIS